MNYTERDTYGMYKDMGKPGKGPGPQLMGANTLDGNDVYNHKGEDLGDIKEIMLDVPSGRVAYAVLSFGGFLSMGEKLFAVPWSALKLDTENKRFILNVEKVQQYIEQLGNTFDTYGITRTFQATRGESVTIDGGTYGNLMDREAEYEYLIDAFYIF